MSCRSPLTARGDAGLGQQWLDDVHPRVHRARRDEHLGNVELVSLEFRAHDRHAGDQPVIDYVGRAYPFVHRGLSQLSHFFSIAGDHGIGYCLQVRHFTSSC